MKIMYNASVKANSRLYLYAKAFRVNQWTKNLVVFTPIVFSGKLLEGDLFIKSFYAFIVFCLLSSTSYLLNDIIDFPFDRKHPVKKNRPIASGAISIQHATFLVFVMTLISLVISLFFSLSLFGLAFAFILLHFFYSLYLKKFSVVDIFSISLSFMIRAFAGEIVTGYHIPIWLTLTIFFISLFMATVKRHAELVSHGTDTRVSMVSYNAHLLDFLTNTFATLTIISYSFYTYFEKLPVAQTVLTAFFTELLPSFEARKWMMLTIPFVVYGVARYAQLLYEKSEGERPEKIIIQDGPLMFSVSAWVTIIVLLIYVL